jgi:hypothetical protein
MQLQSLCGKPFDELAKVQQHERRTLEKKLGLCNASSQDVQAHQRRLEWHQLQLLTQTVQPRQRRWSDHRRRQHLACLPRVQRDSLLRQALTEKLDEKQLVIKLRRAEQKAHQLVCRNRRNASDRKKAANVRRPGWGKAFDTVGCSEFEVAMACDCGNAFDC